MARLLYFAYGANMDTRRFRRRCPDSVVLGRALLRNHRLAFTRYDRAEKGGVADIVADAGSQVWGALYDINDACLRALDDYEGAPRAYRRETVRVADDKAREHDAIAYVANKTGDFAPSRTYLAQLIRGARAHDLPEEYVRAIEETRTYA